MKLYGFHTLQDLADSRITGALVEAVNTAITAAVQEHNRQMDALMALFVERTTEYKRRFAQVSAVRLQPIDEDGRARPVKPGGYYDVAWPIQMAGAAWGANFVARAKMTVADAERATSMMLEGDFRWMRDHILAALFTNTAWTFKDPLFGDLSIQPLANGDGVTYPVTAGGDAATTDNHYLAQADAISDLNDPFPVIYDELREHPENTGEIIALIPTNVKAAVERLDAFRPARDPNLQPSSAVDVLIGDLGVQVPGRLIGYHTARVWIAEWPSLPNDYLIALATGGLRPLRMREDPEPELQGFNLVARRDDHPFYESQYVRRAGFGAWNRVGALVYRIGNANYAVPAGYAAPLP